MALENSSSYIIDSVAEAVLKNKDKKCWETLIRWIGWDENNTIN